MGEFRSLDCDEILQGEVFGEYGVLFYDDVVVLEFLLGFGGDVHEAVAAD